jgi:hypothetical protein
MDEFDDDGDVEETEFLDEAGEAGIQWDSPRAELWQRYPSLLRLELTYFTRSSDSCGL